MLTIKNSWAIRNHRQIEKCWNYTRIFILFWTRIEWMLPTLENSWPRRNHRLIRKSLYFIRPMQKNDFFKSMQHVNFEPTCTCQKVVPHKLLLSLQSCACWSESVVGSPRSHKCLTGTPTLVRYRTLTGTRGVCRISNYLGAPRTHPIQTDKLTRDVLVDLRHFFCICLMK